jgi:predicted Zn-dependent protease
MAFPKRIGVAAATFLTLVATCVAPAARAQDDDIHIVTDTEIEEILKQETLPVLKTCGAEVNEVRFHLVSDKTLNAFTAGGQDIFLNTGLIEETANPNELLGVVAHECGHIAGGHAARQGEMMNEGMKPMLITMALGILAAAAGRPDAGAALMMSSGYFGTLSVLKYSREQESRADQAAATSLEAAGISGKGLVDFLDRFRYQEVFDDARRFKYFQSHPVSADRIEALRRRVEAMRHYTDVDSPPDVVAMHELMKAKLDAFMNPPWQTLEKYKASDTSFKARYARAIAWYQAKEMDKAIKALDALLVDYPNNPYIWEVKGQVYFDSGRPAEAAAAHRRSVELKPNAPLLQINLAQSLLAVEMDSSGGAAADEAIIHLKKALALDHDQPLAWRLMAQAYDAKHMAGEARLAEAEYDYSIGDLSRAKAFAMRAREFLRQNTPEWLRATDIVLESKPSQNDLRSLAQGDRGGG